LVLSSAEEAVESSTGSDAGSSGTGVPSLDEAWAASLSEGGEAESLSGSVVSSCVASGIVSGVASDVASGVASGVASSTA